MDRQLHREGMNPPWDQSMEKAEFHLQGAGVVPWVEIPAEPCCSTEHPGRLFFPPCTLFIWASKQFGELRQKSQVLVWILKPSSMTLGTIPISGFVFKKYYLRTGTCFVYPISLLELQPLEFSENLKARKWVATTKHLPLITLLNYSVIKPCYFLGAHDDLAAVSAHHQY